MELLLKLKRNSSLLKSKKTVIFIVNPEKQIFTEFSENTNILSIKKYISSYLNNKYIDILYKGRTVNNKLNLNDLCRNNRDIKRLLFQVINKKEAKIVKEEENKINNYQKEINEIKNNNLNLNNELSQLKKENSKKEIEIKNSDEKCKNINDLYEKQEQEINELRKELTKINDDINHINNINMDNKDYSIEKNIKVEILNRNNIKKSNSIVNSVTTYTINGKRNVMDDKKQLTDNLMKKPKSYSVDYSTINSNINNTSNNNSEVIIDSNNNYIYTTCSTKNEMIKKTDLIDKEIIQKGYNPKYLEINFKSIYKELSLEENDKNINNIKKWFIVFKFLNLDDQLSFSLIDKQNGINSLYYWIYYLNHKIKKIDNRYDIIYKTYTLINETHFFILSRFAKTAFKMLNNESYSKVFEKPLDYFKDENQYFISTYKILYQLTKIFENEDIISMENNIFLNKMIENMKNRNGNGGTLGNYIQNMIPNKLDLSFENVIKINEILKKYNINKMNTNEISKLDKTTGVISIIIKEVLIHMGFFLEEKNKDEKIFQKNNIINEFQNNIILKESYIENINKIKNIILHSYNI